MPYPLVFTIVGRSAIGASVGKIERSGVLKINVVPFSASERRYRIGYFSAY